MEIKFVKNENPAAKPDSATLGFGKIFTDHMFIMDFSREGAATVQEREMYLSWAALDAFVENTAREIARTISGMMA